MSSGIDLYWKNKKAYDHEQRVIAGLILIMIKLLDIKVK